MGELSRPGRPRGCCRLHRARRDSAFPVASQRSSHVQRRLDLLPRSEGHVGRRRRWLVNGALAVVSTTTDTFIVLIKYLLYQSIRLILFIQYEKNVFFSIGCFQLVSKIIIDIGTLKLYYNKEKYIIILNHIINIKIYLTFLWRAT
jgi:hypothetical protein